MKKSVLKVLLIAIFLLTITKIVYAADPSIIIEGDDSIAPGATKEMTVKIISEEDVGVISGSIEKNELIKSFTLSGENGWNITFNQQTGKFNVVKAEGAKQEVILKIQYVASDVGGTGTITLKGVKATTINYETKELGDILKEISIVEITPPVIEEPTLVSITISKEPTKTNYIEGEKFDKTGMEITALYSNGTTKKVTSYTYSPTRALQETDTKVIITVKEGNITKTAEQTIKVVKENIVEPGTGDEGDDNGGIANPGNNNGGTVNPGNNNGGTVNPGNSNGGTANPGNSNGGTANPGNSNGGTANPGNNNGGTANPGNSNGGTANPGNNNGGTANPGNSNGGITKTDNSNENNEEKLPYTGIPSVAILIVLAGIVLMSAIKSIKYRFV